MTREKLNTELYERMYAEQQEYKAGLLVMTPAEILGQAYEYTVREDMVCCIEELDLTERQARALLKFKNPLS